jgi:hypothetical protein
LRLTLSATVADEPITSRKLSTQVDVVASG